MQIDPADPLGLQAGVSLCLAEALRDGFRPAAEVLRQGHQCGFTPKQLRSAASSKNQESLEKQGVFQRPASGPLPRDGYARRQERKRRRQERDNARRRQAGS